MDEIELEDLKEVVQNKTNIIKNQRPPYVMDFPSPYSQNFEDLIVSIEVQNMKLLNPLVNKNNWDMDTDEYGTPTISILQDDDAETKSGVINGMTITVDLGKTIDSLKFIYHNSFIYVETFDNGDPSVHYDAFEFIINNKDSFPAFALEGQSIRYNKDNKTIVTTIDYIYGFIH